MESEIRKGIGALLLVGTALNLTLFILLVFMGNDAMFRHLALGLACAGFYYVGSKDGPERNSNA